MGSSFCGRIFIFASFLSTFSCVTLVKNVKMVSYDSNPKASKPIGPVSSVACVTKIFNVQLGPDPTLTDALAELASKKKFTYVQGLKLEGSSEFNIFIYGRKCLGITAVAFQ